MYLRVPIRIKKCFGSLSLVSDSSSTDSTNIQAARKNPAPPEPGNPSEYDKMITDMLKHVTTLNTGLLAIIAAFNQQLVPLFRLHPDFTTYFLLTFFLSLALCMAGFVATIYVLHERNSRAWSRRREIMIFIAAIGYVFSLMFLLALFTRAYQGS